MTADIRQIEDEIGDRVHALAFDAKGANAEVERLRRAIERILEEVERVNTWTLKDDSSPEFDV